MNGAKCNKLTLAGAVLCLASMLFGYVKFDVIVYKYSLSWMNVARFINYAAYLVPVIGIVMLFAAFIENPALKLVANVLGIAFCVYYLLTFRSVANGDLVRYLAGGTALLSFANLNPADIQGTLAAIGPFMRLDVGAILFMIGTVISLLGTFIVSAPAPKAKSEPVQERNRF